MAEKSTWLPLESNPEVMTKFVRVLGVPNNWQLVDVLGLDPELLQMVPRPAVAVLLLFPYREQAQDITAAGKAAKSGGENQNVYFMKQTIHNACGSVALIHAIANNQDQIQLDGDKPLKKFLDATKSLTPDERATQLEKNKDIGTAHEAHAREGQSSAPDTADTVNHHYVTFVNVGGVLYELDGRKSVPIAHGSTSDGTFLEDASQVCKQYMEKDPSELQFSVVALSASPGDH